jgi:hypothetical protein
MMHSADSPWKPLICNFPPTYDNFLQMQSSEELERATAEINIANPHWNATKVVEREVNQAAVNIHGVVAAVNALFPDIFPSRLPAKVFMHARMAVLSRAWGMDGQNVLCPIADLFNHQEPTHVVISIQKEHKVKREGPLDTVEVVLKRRASKGEEIFNGARLFAFSVRPVAHTCVAAYTYDGCIPQFVTNFGKFRGVPCRLLRWLRLDVPSGAAFWISCIACRLFAPGISQSCVQTLKAKAVSYSFARIEKLDGARKRTVQSSKNICG